MSAHPRTPAQMCALVRGYGRPKLVGVGVEPWQRGRHVRADRGGALRIPYGKPYADEQGYLQVVVVRFRVDN